MRDKLLLAEPGSTNGNVDATDLSVRASLVALEASFDRLRLTFPVPVPLQGRLRAAVSTVSLQHRDHSEINK